MSDTMTHPTTGTREEWLAARLELLEAEKELTRRSDELARRRRELPWVPIDKEYRFDTETGTRTLAELFDGRSQLLVYHFMFSPDYAAGCSACSSIADGFDGSVVHLANRDVTLLCVSRAPLERLLAYRERMGWSFPWVSSGGSDFNYDFSASFTAEQLRETGGEYNFRRFADMASLIETDRDPIATQAANSDVTPGQFLEEAPGMSAFALSDGVVHHTYSAYARGLDALWGAYQWLDRAPLGRADSDPPGAWTRKDEYVIAP